MNKHSDHDTREHLLITGEQLCMRCGFSAMGLSELLNTAKVSKGSFYHYFRSKEVFGVAMLERYYAGYHQQLRLRLSDGAGSFRDRLLAYYQQALTLFAEQGTICGCLTVKLSAEVCDLSEVMREAMNAGVNQTITLLAWALDEGRQEGSLLFDSDARSQAQILYSLWLGANLQAKISRSAAPLQSALACAKVIIAPPASNTLTLIH